MKNHTSPKYFITPQHPITINLIGCGGTGSQLLTQLARIDATLRAGGLGLGDHPGLHVRAFDGDNVSAANIGRQNFSESDIGHNKATVLISRINRFFGQEWEAHPYMYDNQVVGKNLHMANIIITCVDSAKARIEIAQINKAPQTKQDAGPESEDYFFMMERNRVQLHQYQQRYYWLDLGNSRNSGQVILGTIGTITQPDIPGATAKLPTIIDLFPDLLKHDTKEQQGGSCSVAESIINQDLCTNSQMAEWGKKLIWNLFKQMRIEYHGVFVNLETMTVNPLPIRDAQRSEQLKRVHKKSRRAASKTEKHKKSGRKNSNSKRNGRSVPRGSRTAVGRRKPKGKKKTSASRTRV